MSQEASSAANTSASTDSSASSAPAGTGASVSSDSSAGFQPTFQEGANVAAETQTATTSTETPNGESQTSSTEAETSAAEQPADVRDFIKQGLAKITGTAAAEAAAETEEGAQTSETTEAQTEEIPPIDSTTDVDPTKATETEGETETETEKPLLPNREPIPTDDEFDAKFNRISKDARAEMKPFLAEARENRELIQKLGGEHFLAPMTTIAEGVQSGEVNKLWSGYLEATGVEGFTDMIGTTLDVALNQIMTGEPANEGEQFLKERVTQAMDAIYAEKFGEGVDSKLIEKLAKYHAGGYLNTADVDSYYEEGAGDVSENPVIKEKNDRIAELESKLGEKSNSEAEAQADKERVINEKFTTETNNSLNKVLDQYVFESSAINPVATDSQEVVAAKEASKTLVTSLIQSQMKDSPAYKALLKSFKQGGAKTAAYQTKVTNLMETMQIEAKEWSSKLEGAFALKSTNSRDAQLLQQKQIAKPADKTQETKQPETKTESQFDPNTASPEERRKWLSSQLG